MPTVRATLSLVALCACASIASAEVRVSEDKAKISHDCRDDPSVVIAGNRTEVTLLGVCQEVSINGNANRLRVVTTQRLSVHGNGNTVSADLVDAIQVVGNRNRVDYRGPTTEGGRTGVSNLGKKNQVVRGS